MYSKVSDPVSLLTLTMTVLDVHYSAVIVPFICLQKFNAFLLNLFFSIAISRKAKMYKICLHLFIFHKCLVLLPENLRTCFEPSV
jgi:hypothetical protein